MLPVLFRIVVPPNASIIAASHRHLLWEIVKDGNTDSFLVTNYDGEKIWQWQTYREVRQNLRFRYPRHGSIYPIKNNYRGRIYAIRSKKELICE